MEMRKLVQLLTVIISVCLTSSVARAECGKERWTVKVTTDKDKAHIQQHPTPSNIAKLVNISAPVNPNIRKDTRYADELKSYEITAYLKLIKLEKDGDYHIVISDERNRTMIVEAANPDCAQGGRFESEITDVRQTIESEFGGPVSGKKTFKSPNRPVVTVTGVAFFDRLHGQEGVAPNGIELHPIVQIEFHKEKTIQAVMKRVQSAPTDD